jgi:protocatechuate 4,5-dioxygenase beta chain
MAKIIAGVGTSHIPSIGATMDNGKTDEDYWRPLFEGFGPAREWMAETRPDVCIVVYNDHASAFSLENIATFAIGVAERFPSADEGYGPRPVPDCIGHPELAWHITESLVLDEFDMTIVNEMPVDHGLTVPLSIMYDQPEAWPCKVIPICINMVQYPQPTGRRCYKLGKALRKAVESFPEDLRVAVFGTGGLSHQLQGERAGLTNVEYDIDWLNRFVDDPESLLGITHTEYLRETGSEGIEAVMWLVMRGAMQANVEEVYRFTRMPVSNTHYAMTLLENHADRR